AEARMGDQTLPAPASANVYVTEEQPRTSAEALVGGQTLLVSANANVSAEPPTKDNVADSSSAETVEQETEGWDKSADTTPMQEDAAVPGGESQISQHRSPQKAEAAEPQRPDAPDNSSVAQETTRPVPDATRPQNSEKADDTVQQRGSI